MAPAFFSLDCNATEALEAVLEAEENSDDDGFLTGQYVWLFGVACSVVSSIATAVGTIMQKKAHNHQASLPDDEKDREIAGIVFNRYWLIALVIMVVFPLPFDFASFALAPQSVVVPMSGLTIVLSALIAVLLLGEKLTSVEVIGIMAILGGVAMTTVTAGGNSTTLSVCDLLNRYSDADFYGIAIALGVGIVTCMYWIKTDNYPRQLEAFKPQMYAFVAGGLGAYVQVLFKATAELAKGSVGGVKTSTWLTVHPYYHIVGVVLLALGMLSYLNLLLSRVDAVIATPLYFTNLIVCSSTLGLIFYKEYSKFEVWQWVVFPLGILVVCSGVAFMSLKGVDLQALRIKEAELARAKEARISRSGLAPRSRTSTKDSLKRVMSLGFIKPTEDEQNSVDVKEPTSAPLPATDVRVTPVSGSFNDDDEEDGDEEEEEEENAPSLDKSDSDVSIDVNFNL